MIKHWVRDAEPLGEYCPPAERASGVGEQPCVNAGEVEGVAADRQKPELVVGLELAEADGAVEGLLGAEDLPVEEERQRVDEGLVEAGIVEAEKLAQLSLERAGAGRVEMGGGGRGGDGRGRGEKRLFDEAP